MKALGDILIVEVKKQKIESSTIVIPEIAQDRRIQLVEAEVFHVGSKFRYKNEVSIYDIVYVPCHLGTKLSWEPNGTELTVFDGEDIYALKKFPASA